MTQTSLEKTTDEELISMLLIENHNIESCSRKMHELGRNESLDELFQMFVESYNSIHTEILRRMKDGHS